MPDRERVGAGARRPQSRAVASVRSSSLRSAVQLVDRLADVACDAGLDLERRAVGLGREAVVRRVGRQARQDARRSGGRAPRCRGSSSITSSSIPTVQGPSSWPLGPVGPGRQRRRSVASFMRPRCRRRRRRCRRRGRPRRNARNSACSSGRWTSVSACHWTPIRNCAARVLDRLDRAVGRPGADREALAEPLDRLVVEGVDVDLGRADRRGEPAVRARSSTWWLGWSPGLRWRWATSRRRVREGAGTSVPPRATLSAWVPRQIARIGMSRCVGRAARSRARSGRGRARSGRAAGGARRRRCRGRGRARRRGRCRRAGRAAARSASSRSGGITTGMPPGRLDRPQVGEPERHLVPRRLALRAVGSTRLGRAAPPRS